MVEVKRFTSESYIDFLKLLQFRYNVYVQELSYLEDKNEFKLLRMEYDEYDKYATFIVLQIENEIKGCARIVEDKYIGLPVYKKTDCSAFGKGKNVEVGRLILIDNKKNARYFGLLMKEIFDCVQEMDCNNILVDVFRNSESYKILKRLGFRESNVDYEDPYFEPDINSTVLYYNLKEMRKEIITKSNKTQQNILRYESKNEKLKKSI